MLKLIGGCIVMAGALGTGVCICVDRKRRIEMLSILQRAFFWMAGEIAYSRISLPEVFTETGRRLQGGFGTGERKTLWAEECRKDFGLGEILLRTGQRLQDGSGQDMQRVWQEEMSLFLPHTGLLEQEKAFVLSFAEAVGFQDGARQQEAVAEFSRRMQERALAAQKQRKEADKITMTFCMACGLMAVILLL